jgi:hypothetical protein
MTDPRARLMNAFAGLVQRPAAGNMAAFPLHLSKAVLYGA